MAAIFVFLFFFFLFFKLLLTPCYGSEYGFDIDGMPFRNNYYFKKRLRSVCHLCGCYYGESE